MGHLAPSLNSFLFCLGHRWQLCTLHFLGLLLCQLLCRLGQWRAGQAGLWEEVGAHPPATLSSALCLCLVDRLGSTSLTCARPVLTNLQHSTVPQSLSGTADIGSAPCLNLSCALDRFCCPGCITYSVVPTPNGPKDHRLVAKTALPWAWPAQMGFDFRFLESRLFTKQAVAWSLSSRSHEANSHSAS